MLAVLPRAREVDLAVGGVEVAHHEHALAAAAQALELLEERAVEVELVGHAAVVAVLAAAVREVDVRDDEACRSARSGAGPRRRSAARRARSRRRRARAARRARRRCSRAARRRRRGVPAGAGAQPLGQLLGCGAHLLQADDLAPRALEPADAKPFVPQARRPFTFQETTRSPALPAALPPPRFVMRDASSGRAGSGRADSRRSVRRLRSRGADRSPAPGS